MDFSFVDGLDFVLGFVDCLSNKATTVLECSFVLDAPLALAFFTATFFYRSFYFSCLARSSASISSYIRLPSRMAGVFSVSFGFCKVGCGHLVNRGWSSSVCELNSLTVAEEGAELEES